MTGETGMKCDMNKDDAIAKLELLIKEGERVLATSQVNTHKRIPEIRRFRGQIFDCHSPKVPVALSNTGH